MKFNFRLALAAIAFAFAPIAVAACAIPGTNIALPNVTSPDASFQQNAYGVLATYGEAAQEIAELVESPDTPAGVKEVLATALLNSEAPALAVKAAVQAYDAKLADIKARQDAGQSIPDIVFAEAGDLYATAKGLWEQHKDALSSLPGVVKLVKK